MKRKSRNSCRNPSYLTFGNSGSNPLPSTFVFRSFRKFRNNKENAIRRVHQSSVRFMTKHLFTGSCIPIPLIKPAVFRYYRAQTVCNSSKFYSYKPRKNYSYRVEGRGTHLSGLHGYGIKRYRLRYSFCILSPKEFYTKNRFSSGRQRGIVRRK